MAHAVTEAIEAIRNGEMVVVSDDAGRENEGDLVIAAEKTTPAAINFMATHGRGLICAPITAGRAGELGLPEMAKSTDRFGTAFTVSVDAREGTTTGISAHDRARTVQLLVEPTARREDFYIPGHVFPLIARDGGVLARPGHTEAAVDLAHLAGLQPAGVICEILNEGGSMAHGSDIEQFVARHKLKQVAIAELVRWRREHDHHISAVAAVPNLINNSGSVKIPSRYAEKDFELYCYVSQADAKEHVALVYGQVHGAKDLLVRVHSECLTGDVFHSARCDCGEQLEQAIEMIVAEGRGIVVYLRQEGRDIGLINKIRAYMLQDRHGMDTVDANVKLGFPPDARDYSVAAHILQDLDVTSVRLLTNNPAKLEGLREHGVNITERAPLLIPPREQNAFYLQTKKNRLGHLL